MFNVRPVWEMAVQLTVTGDVFDGVLLRSGTELSQFLSIFLYAFGSVRQHTILGSKMAE